MPAAGVGLTCPDCGSEEPSSTCCVWAKARSYDDLKEEYDALERENYELQCLCSNLRSEIASLEIAYEDQFSRLQEFPDNDDY